MIPGSSTDENDFIALLRVYSFRITRSLFCSIVLPRMFSEFTIKVFNLNQFIAFLHAISSLETYSGAGATLLSYYY